MSKLALNATDPQAINNIRRQAEGHPLGRLQRLAALEQAVEVDVDDVA